MPRKTDTREVTAAEEKFTGFVFKIQPTWIRNTATVWPSCAWCPAATKGMKLRQVRTGKDVVISRRADLYGRRPFARGRSLPATSSACTTTAPFRSAIPSPVVKT